MMTNTLNAHACSRQPKFLGGGPCTGMFMEVFMVIQPSEARELCSKSEWDLVESSFSPAIETLRPLDVRSKMDRVRRLHKKCTDLVIRQHSDSRKRTTLRKAELFAQTVAEYEAILSLSTNAQELQLTSKDADKKVADKTAAFHLDMALRERADREFQSRKTRVLSALGVRSEQQGQRSGAKHIQSHVGSAARRQQGRRDSKNR